MNRPARAALLLALLAGLLAAAAAPARAEYRAYELEVTDILDCRLNQREKCKRFRVRTAMSPPLYTRTHGGEERIGVILLATWMCRGDTSNFDPVCPMPPPREPKFAVGDEVVVRLKKHITEGWRGKVEVAYHQASISANVYGVRFAERQQVYARYFEKDLAKAEAAQAGEGKSPPSTAASP